MAEKIIIAGGSGFIGAALVKKLAPQYDVFILTRNPTRENHIYWNPSNHAFDKDKVLNTDHLINLTGASISKPWTPAYKKEIIQSRIDSLTCLQKIMEVNPNLKTFISASATGFYGHRPHQKVDESSTPGTGFLADTCVLWENAFHAIQHPCRKILIRISNVISPNGGMLKQLIQLSRWGILSPLGDGNQSITWIGLNDLVELFYESISNNQYNGIINANNEQWITNEEFTKIINNVYGWNPIAPKVPALLLKIMIGERSQLVLNSQQVIPQKLKQLNFNFSEVDLTKIMN